MREWINLFEKWDATIPVGHGNHCDVFRNPSHSEFLKLMSKWNDQGRVSFSTNGDVILFDSDAAVHDWVAKHYSEIDREYPTAMVYGYRDDSFLIFHHLDRYDPKWINTHILPEIRSNRNVTRMLGRTRLVVEYEDGTEGDITTDDYVPRAMNSNMDV